MFSKRYQTETIIIQYTNRLKKYRMETICVTYGMDRMGQTYVQTEVILYVPPHTTSTPIDMNC